jgi:hypothetical protein
VLKITVHDRHRAFVGQIGNPSSLTVTVREFPLIGSATMTVPMDHPKADALMADGARVVFQFKGRVELSGPVDEFEIDTDTESLTVTVVDDAHLLFRILGWQNPIDTTTAGNMSQSVREYINYTGIAETLIKGVVQANGINRLGVPGLVVAPDLARGATVPGGASFRMHPLPDRLFPAVAMAGIGVTLKQVGTDLVFDVYEPRTYPRTLSVEGRTLKRAVWSQKRPSASQVVIGGPGEGKLRKYRRLIDTARESQYGFMGEVFRDARDAKDETEPENVAVTEATMDARGQETLTESAATNGLFITLAESTVFTYGEDGVLVGDKVPVRIGTRTITDTIKEATLEWVSPDYVSAVPIIGEQIDPERRTVQAIAALRESQRKEERA